MPVVNNQVVHYRNTLYQLRQDYGTRVDVYRILYTETDPDTGVRSWLRKVYRVPHGVLLPSVLAQKFFYALSYIAANKNFTYGGAVDLKTRSLILDGRELPKDFAITSDDMIVIDNVRYAVKDSTDLDYGLGFLVTLLGVVGQQPFQDLAIRVGSSMSVYHGASNE